MIRLIRTQSTRRLIGPDVSRDTRTLGHVRRRVATDRAATHRAIRKSQDQIAFARCITPVLREPLLTDEQLAEQFLREMDRDELHQAAQRLNVCEPNVNACLSAGLDGVKGGAS